MAEAITNTPEVELCPHGNMPGICAECLNTEKGTNKQSEIREQAKNIGSERAKELWRKLEADGEDPREHIYDMVMILGAGFREPDEDFGQTPSTEGKKPNASSRLNKEFRMRLIAGAQMYLDGRVRMLCLTGGPAVSEKWKKMPALADLAKEFLIEKFEIPEKDIVLENVSDATHGNLAHGLRTMYADNLPIGKFAMLSTGYHLRRAKKMAKESGIESGLIPAEKELAGRHDLYKSYAEGWKQYAKDAGLHENENAKLDDPVYWEKRAALFTTPLNQEVPDIDISSDVAATADRLSASSAEGLQTDSF